MGVRIYVLFWLLMFRTHHHSESAFVLVADEVQPGSGLSESRSGVVEYGEALAGEALLPRTEKPFVGALVGLMQGLSGKRPDVVRHVLVRSAELA
jgi:hypothetical protein